MSISKYQREIVVPFHFIPIKPLKEFSSDCSRSEYRTAPADIKGSFLIKDLLDDARNKYRENAGKYELMRIGILLHIFADTYAHQNFSGFWGWENFSYLKRVTDNFQGDQDITKNYKPEFYKGICAVGHAEVGHAPDDTYASFEMSMAENERQKSKNSYALQFNRSNTQVFADAAKQIFTYLYLCCQNKEPVEEQWNKLREVLVQGFAFKDKDENALARAWCGIYNGLYRYDKKELWDNKLVMDGNSTPDLRNLSTSLQANGDLLNYDDISVIKCKTADEDFFRYNLIAKEIRDKIIEP